MARLEHLNITVSDPAATARMLGDRFGWQIRWEGASIYGGRSIHVGEADTYLAIYSGRPDTELTPVEDSYSRRGGLNHIGIVVDDLDATEAAVKARGYEPHAHADYEPGRRFYFDEENGIEIEVVCYA